MKKIENKGKNKNRIDSYYFLPDTSTCAVTGKKVDSKKSDP